MPKSSAPLQDFGARLQEAGRLLLSMVKDRLEDASKQGLAWEGLLYGRRHAYEELIGVLAEERAAMTKKKDKKSKAKAEILAELEKALRRRVQAGGRTR